MSDDVVAYSTPSARFHKRLGNDINVDRSLKRKIYQIHYDVHAHYMIQRNQVFFDMCDVEGEMTGFSFKEKDDVF